MSFSLIDFTFWKFVWPMVKHSKPNFTFKVLHFAGKWVRIAKTRKWSNYA